MRSVTGRIRGGDPRSIVETIDKINEITAQVSAAVVGAQSAATQEIARSVQEAAQGTASVDENITGVTQAADLTGAAAGEVRARGRQSGRASCRRLLAGGEDWRVFLEAVRVLK